MHVKFSREEPQTPRPHNPSPRNHSPMPCSALDIFLLYFFSGRLPVVSLFRRFSFLCVSVGAQGVLFVLLQHQLLSSLEEEERQARAKDQVEEEREKAALFSLVAVNPLSGKSFLAAHLCPPKAWSGRWDEGWCICASLFLNVHVANAHIRLCVLQAVRSWRGRLQRGGPESERLCVRVAARASGDPEDGVGSWERRLAAGTLGRRGHTGDWTSQRRRYFTLCH